jgi:hypothetical protein
MRKTGNPLGWTIAAGILWSTLAQASILPDWVNQAKSQTLPTYDGETEAVVLLDEQTFTVRSPDEYIDHYRQVVKILRPNGRWAGEFAVHYRGQEKIQSLHAWSVDRAGHEYEVKDKDFVDRGVSIGYILYDDVRLKTTKVPGADVGSVVAFEYEVRRHPWIHQLNNWFQMGIPVHEAKLALEVPAGWEYRIAWSGIASLEAKQVSPTRTEWTARDLPAIEHEPMRPPIEALAAQATIAYFGPGTSPKEAGSWDNIGRWYVGLSDGRRNATPELTQKANDLTAGTPDFDGKARAIAGFLQKDVRYVAIEIGIGGFQPHPASDIFRARYGDCKDKATLMSSMLREVGIASQYVIIDTERGVVHPEMPSTYFNHAILAIEIPEAVSTAKYGPVVQSKGGKKYLIFDPTDEFTPFGSLRGELQDTYALLVTDGAGELIHTPLAPPETNLYARSGRFTLQPNGALAGEVRVKSSGDHALYEREMLMYKDERQRQQFLEHGLNGSVRGFALEKTEIQKLDALQEPVEIGMQFSVPAYAQERGPLVLLRPRVLGEKGFAVERKPRKYAFQFEGTTKETDEYEIEIPKEYTVDDVPEPVKVDMGFARYESKVEVSGSKIRYARTFERKAVLVPAERADDVRKLMGLIGADEAAVVVLKKAQ